LDKYF